MRTKQMRGLVFVLGTVLALLIFGLPILACFMGLLVIGLGIAVEASFFCGAFLTVALVIGIGIKVFFVDD